MEKWNFLFGLSVYYLDPIGLVWLLIAYLDSLAIPLSETILYHFM